MHIFDRVLCMEGCYSSQQRRWQISVPHADGFNEIVSIDHLEKCTVENLLTELLKALDIPLAALPVCVLTKKAIPDTTSSPEKKGERWIKRLYGLPFFLPLPKPCQLFFRIDPDLLPAGGDEREKLLNNRGCEVLTAQVLSEAVLADLSDPVPIELLFRGLKYLETRGKDSEMDEIRKKWISRISRRSYSAAITIARQLSRHNIIFVQRVENRYRENRRMSDNPKLFFANVETFTPIQNPFFLLAEIKNASDDEFDHNSFLCQLDSLLWNSRRKKLTVSFFRNFSEGIETVTMKRRINARKFSLIIRYLAIRNPAVKCSIKHTGGHVSRIYLRALSSRDETYGFNGAGDKETVETIVEDSIPLSAPKMTEMQEEQFSTLHRIQEETRGYGIQLTVKREPKESVDRLLDVSCNSPLSNYGINTEMRKGIRLSSQPDDDDEGETTVEFAVRRLKDYNIMDESQVKLAGNMRTLAKSAYLSMDVYSRRWPLLPVEGMRMDEEMKVFSRWMPLGSLHDLLFRIKTSDESFSVRHFLQSAAQLCAALVFLEHLGITDVGLHPRNVLVEDHLKERIRVRLSDAGTKSLQQESEWLEYRKNCFHSPIADDLKDLHITLRLSTLYRPGMDFLQANDKHSLDNIPAHLWRYRDAFSTFQLLLWSRELLKCEEDEVKKELDRPLSAKISIQDVPSVMRMDSDHETWRLGREQKSLGKGNFGVVYLTTYRDGDDEFPVAVKKLEETPRKDFEKEVDIMKRLRHQHIVQFINCYPKSKVIVMTYCNSGRLLSYVKKTEQSDTELLETGRQFCVEICKGMDYLHSEGVIHRDLALRNILLHSEADKLTVKISDFGLSRILKEEVYELKNNGKLPAYWLPPSDMLGSGLIKKVDVWSFGVCMWEIFTRGGNPIEFYYPHTKGQSAKLWTFLNDLIFKENVYLPSDNIDPFMYSIMRHHCWLEKAEERSSFAELLTLFSVGP